MNFSSVWWTRCTGREVEARVHGPGPHCRLVEDDDICARAFPEHAAVAQAVEPSRGPGEVVDRFLDGQQYSTPAREGGVVGLGAATERLLYMSSHLDTRITNTIPQQMNLPKVVSQNWTMDIGSACLAETPGATCPAPAPLPSQSAERTRMRRTTK